MIERFYVEGSLEGLQMIEGKEHHHLAHVMRLKVGDELELINGEGALAKAILKRLDKKSGEVEILSCIKEPPSLGLILVQALVRRTKLEWIFEKGTELGVSEFWLYPAEHSEKGALSDADLERLHALMVAAMKQSGRLFLPKVVVKEPLLKWNTPLKGFIFGDLRKEAPPLFTFKERIDGAIIGPESGFTKQEILQLEKLGAVGSSFTSSVLRTESAAVAASVLLAHLLHTRSFLEQRKQP